MKFSIIVPIYNRPDEGEELLQSLSQQTLKNFELVLVEDGSAKPCATSVEKYKNELEINYIVKPNTGRSDTRNVGMNEAKGDYFVFFDSDCIIPRQYINTLNNYLENDFADCFGGPDSAHQSFTNLQKAVNYAMTSFLTTGGIRGGKVNMEKFVPRTFNMGFTKQVYQTVGGFDTEIDYGEDMDISSRVRKAGFTTKLYHNAFVYHKRRVSFKQFYKQVNNFGYSRIATIYKLYPETLKAVHFLPAAFVVGTFSMVICALIFRNCYFITPLLLYIIAVFTDSLIQNKSFNIAVLSIWACFVQLFGYGNGFIRACTNKLFGKTKKLV